MTDKVGVINQRGFYEFTEEQKADMRYEHCPSCGWRGLLKDAVCVPGDKNYDEEHLYIMTCPECGSGTY